MPRQPKIAAGKRTRARAAKAPATAFCSHCRVWQPVDHVCPSGNKARAARGLRPVFALRMPTQLRERLDARVEALMARQRWPRVTAASLVLEAVERYLAEVDSD